MPRFLAVYTMPAEAVTHFRALPKSEQDAIDARGLKQWADWEQRNAGAIRDHGGMVGKTMRADRSGIAPAVNTICGYLIVEAESSEAAAKLFADHPHFNTFPGEAVDIMPFVTEPKS